MLPEALDADFFEGRRSAALPFCVNDPVVVTAGVHTGRQGSVVVLDRRGPAPRFLVEFGDGTDEMFAATEIRQDV